jgi:hypothetical protein
MPLGQAPFGTRTPPEPEPGQGPPQAGPPAFGRLRWFFWVLLAALAGVTAWQMWSEKPKPVSDSTECLTTASCGAGWRCYAVPKDDPFAVTGVCSHECADDAQCAAPLKCTEVAVTEHQVLPLGAKGGGAERTHVCRPP